MKKFLTVIAFFQLQCAGPVININLEPVDDWKTNIYYYQGTPIAVSKLKNSILTTYAVKTPSSQYQLFLSAKNLSEKNILLSHDDVSVILNTKVGQIESETLDPNEVLSKKIRADNLELGLMAMNAALSQVSTTSGTVGGNQVNLTTTQSGYNLANAQILEQKSSNAKGSTVNLRNSLLFKNTVLPNQEVSGLVYIKGLPGFIRTSTGNVSTSGIKVLGFGVNVKVGDDFHIISYNMP